MKKKSIVRDLNLFLNINWFRKMKLTVFLVTIAIFQVMSIESSAQSSKISLSLKNATIKDIIQSIEKQSEFIFFYSDEEIDMNKTVDLNIKNFDIENILKEVLHDYHYQIENRKIVLIPKIKQNHSKITGVVKDKNGEVIVGANVSVKGTTNGSITDIEGTFAISASPNDILQVSYIGYKTQELSIKGKTFFQILLEENSEALEEVVVVGYGTQKKVSVTGSLASTSGKEIGKIPTISITNTLTGRLPGLVGVNNTGEPGFDDAELLIRGRSTTGDSSPLIVVDGVADRAGGFSRIDPQDIENVTILKDASAAIYGSRAANGVILVTTKRGKDGKAVVSYTGNIGFSRPTVLPKMCESWQYAELQNEIERYIYNRPDKYTPEQIQKYKDGSDPENYANINIYDEVLRVAAPQTQHNLSLSGGSNLVKYYVSLGYQYQENYYKKSASNYAQYNLRSNIDITPHKNFRASINLSARQEDRDSPYYGSETIWRFMTKYYPMANIYWPGTKYPTTPTQENYNPITAVDGSMGYQKNKKSFFNTDITIHYDMPFVTPGLSLDGGLFVDRNDVFYKQFAKQFNLYQKIDNNYVAKPYGPNNASLSENMSQLLGITLNARINYERKFNNTHNLKGFVAYEQYTSRYDMLKGYRQNFISTAVDELFAGDIKSATNDGTASETARMNFFGRIDYDYIGKYMVQFNWRYDGSQNFPKGNRFGFFPGVSLGWRISEESFWKENVSFVDNLKIRASYGKMGNDKVAPYQFMMSYTFSNPAILGGTDPQQHMGILQKRTANPNITWEVANTYNIGLESRFLNYFNLELDLFKTDRSNILAKRYASLPEFSGLSLPDENIAKCSSKGLELSVNYNRTVKDIRFNIGGNFSYATNQIKFIDEPQKVLEWQRKTGKSIGADWLIYECDGIFRTQQELDQYPHLSNAKVGDLRFRDINNDKIIDGNDKIRPNKTKTPEIIYGISGGIEWKQWNLNMLWQGTGRVWQYTFFESGAIGNFTQEYYNNRWTEDNINSSYPMVVDRSATVSGQGNTFWLHNASYLRLKNVDLSYTLPSSLLKDSFISSMRVYVSAYNLLTLTRFKDLDPEVTKGSYAGDQSVTPQSKVINFGVNITF